MGLFFYAYSKLKLHVSENKIQIVANKYQFKKLKSYYPLNHQIIKRTFIIWKHLFYKQLKRASGSVSTVRS